VVPPLRSDTRSDHWLTLQVAASAVPGSSCWPAATRPRTRAAAVPGRRAKRARRTARARTSALRPFTFCLHGDGRWAVTCSVAGPACPTRAGPVWHGRAVASSEAGGQGRVGVRESRTTGHSRRGRGRWVTAIVGLPGWCGRTWGRRRFDGVTACGPMSGRGRLVLNAPFGVAVPSPRRACPTAPTPGRGKALSVGPRSGLAAARVGVVAVQGGEATGPTNRHPLSRSPRPGRGAEPRFGPAAESDGRSVEGESGAEVPVVVTVVSVARAIVRTGGAGGSRRTLGAGCAGDTHRGRRPGGTSRSLALDAGSPRACSMKSVPWTDDIAVGHLPGGLRGPRAGPGPLRLRVYRWSRCRSQIPASGRLADGHLCPNGTFGSERLGEGASGPAASVGRALRVLEESCAI
jgi:hypothetical protein